MSHDDPVARLIEKDRIADVIHAYCYHFDRGEADEVIGLFTQDAVIDYGPDVPVMTGPLEFGPMIRRGLVEFFEATSHHISNLTIEFETGEEATSVCYLYAWHRYKGGGAESELWGQYHHAFRKTDAGWRISRLVLKAAGTRDFHRKNMHPIGRVSPDE